MRKNTFWFHIYASLRAISIPYWSFICYTQNQTETVKCFVWYANVYALPLTPPIPCVYTVYERLKGMDIFLFIAFKLNYFCIFQKKIIQHPVLLEFLEFWSIRTGYLMMLKARNNNTRKDISTRVQKGNRSIFSEWTRFQLKFEKLFAGFDFFHRRAGTPCFPNKCHKTPSILG